MSPIAPHQGQQVLSAGSPIDHAQAAMILVHGRGASAQNILELSSVLDHPAFAYLAPQAAGHSWYPFSFLAPIQENEPGLSSGLQAIGDAVKQATEAGISEDRIIIGGFSQGACLSSEYVARQAKRYGGLLVFSGGLVGPPGTPRDYSGSLQGTPVFLGCSDKDPHIPLARVLESSAIFRDLGGDVTEMIYPDMAHTIIQDEVDQAREIVWQVLDKAS